MKSALVTIIGITLSGYLFAHEGHDIPGALPPAPHGGVVGEAVHSSSEAHKHTGPEKELFFEVVYRSGALSIYPLLLPEGAKTFTAVNPKAELSKVALKVENPRTKKTEALTATVDEQAVASKFEAKDAKRFIVHVVAEYAKELKTAKIQVEKN